ncbi:alpha-L-rhamnosidase C-terminal domain-containing protein [Cohnella soli]|uniref:Alpha-L-rhamnosidase C-terminal domain-containing protein n=1 Tax=Cohnella soli TaxID=425005 RepID=A0ABW0I1X2_9BACL
MEDHNWQARWIWDGDEFACENEIVLFRRSFEVPDTIALNGGYKLAFDVSADSRYRLFLNGKSVSIGPCKGDVHTHYYETVDATKLLRPGKNVLAAKVVHYRFDALNAPGRSGPGAVWRSDRGVFLLQGSLNDGNGREIERLDSDERWRVFRDRSTAFLPERMTLYVGGPESTRGELVPQGWQETDYDDGGWASARIVSETHDGMWGALTPWQLAPRPIPPMREDERSFLRIARASDGIDLKATSSGLSGFVVPAGQRCWLELDAGEYAVGYLRLSLSGGHDAEIGILCSESYEYPPQDGAPRNKGVRDEWREGKALYGPRDEYRVAGFGSEEKPETYEPFWHRAFRFVRFEVAAGEEDVVVREFSYRDTGYPLELRGSFACSDSSFGPLWDISLNTLRRCMHETYEDTPFYEQLQYMMDARLQCLFTYYTSGDDRLARKAIFDFHSSILPSGMLQSSYPTMQPQAIVGFALLWISMVYEHYMHFGDRELAARYRPTIDAVLDWFGRRIGEDGLVGQAPSAYWSFVDWVDQWKDTAGAPPASRVGPLTVYTMMYADALDKAAHLNNDTGREGIASEYRRRAESARQAVRIRCYSSERELYRDGSYVDQYSQHTQIWAVLSGVETGPAATELLERMLAEPELPKASWAYGFFLFRALTSSGLYDRSFGLWDSWRELAALHLTAWAEDPVSQRSDCHAWSAAPLYEFPAGVLGVTPMEPGYARIRIAPCPGPLTWAEGTVPTVRGDVRVSWSVREGRFELSVTAPDGVPVVVNLPDGTTIEREEARRWELTCEYRG